MNTIVVPPTIFRMGKRVYLRPVEKNDLELVTRWINDPEVTQFLTVAYPMTLASELGWYEGLSKKDTDVVLVIALVENNRPIGITGLHKINHINGVATTGSFIGEKDLWSRGYGSEAKMLMLDYAFNTLNLRKVCSQVYSTNPRSKRHLEKCGYQEEGVLRAHAYRNGIYIDIHEMAVFKDEFIPLWEAFKMEVK